MNRAYWTLNLVLTPRVPDMGPRRYTIYTYSKYHILGYWTVGNDSSKRWLS